MHTTVHYHLFPDEQIIIACIFAHVSTLQHSLFLVPVPAHFRATGWTCVVTVPHVLCLVPVSVRGRATVWTCVVTVPHVLCLAPVPVHGRAKMWTCVVTVPHVLCLVHVLVHEKVLQFWIGSYVTRIPPTLTLTCQLLVEA